MTISFHPYVKIGNRWCLPTEHDPENDPNLHNDGAAEVLEDLGVSAAGEMWNADPVDIDVFERALWLAIQGHDGKPSAPTAPDITGGGNRMLVIDFGRSEGYRTRHLEALAELVARGRELGATHIGWG
jgi:hypothetical protein